MSQRQSTTNTSKENITLRSIFVIAMIVLYFAIVISDGNSVMDVFSKEKIVNKYYITSFLKEMSFAFIIACIIAITVEKRSKIEQRKLFEEYLKRYAKSIYAAIFERYIPDEVASEVNSLIFTMPSFRSGMSLTIELQNSDSKDHIILRNSLDFSVKNISPADIEEIVDMSISSPEHLRPSVGVHEMFVNDKEVKPTQSDTEAGVNFRYKFTMRPEEVAKVRIIYSKAKYLADNELITSHVATDGAFIRIEDRVGVGKIHLREIGRHKPEPSAREPNGHAYRIPGVMLPHQGFLLWWEPKYDQ